VYTASYGHMPSELFIGISFKRDFGGTIDSYTANTGKYQH